MYLQGCVNLFTYPWFNLRCFNLPFMPETLPDLFKG